MDNSSYLNETGLNNRQDGVRRIIKRNPSSSSDFSSDKRKRPGSKSGNRGKKKERNLLSNRKIDMQAQNFTVKNSHKFMNRSWSSRNIMSVYPPQEVGSKTDKTYTKIISKYPNVSKQGDKLKDLRKENKRLKKSLEKAENKYKAIENYIQILFSKNDLKKLNKMHGHKMSLIDDMKVSPFAFDKQIKVKSKSKSPNKFQIEKIYMPKGNKTNRLSEWNINTQKLNSQVNLLERSGKKERARGKVSFSSSIRRHNMNQPAQNTKPRCKNTIDYLNSLRREADMSTNANSINDNTLQAIISTYQEKERQWKKDKKILENELHWWREELKAIRIFLCSQDPIEASIEDQNKDIIPAFIRACNISLSDEEDVQLSSKKAPKRLVIKKPSETRKDIYSQVTPLDKTTKKMIKQFYHPGSLDMSSSQLSDTLGLSSTSKHRNDVVISHGKSIFSGHKVTASKTFSKCFPILFLCFKFPF